MSNYSFPQQAPPGIPDNYQLQSWLQRLVRVQDVQLVTSFSNSWANTGGNYLLAGYYKDPWGRVWLQGRVQNGTNDTVAFVLPENYRPLGECSYPSTTATGNGYVKIFPNGNVLLRSTRTNRASYLDGISFRAA